MALIAFTSHLEGIGPTDLVRYDGATVGALLNAVAADYPRLPGYVFDDQGRIRRHVAVFVDGVMRPRDTVLQLPVTEQSEVYVLQALSGG